MILDKIYDGWKWNLRTDEVFSVDGTQTLDLRPSTCYPTGPLLTSVSWRRYSIELLRRNFGGTLHVDMANVSTQSITAWKLRRERDINPNPMPFVLTDSFDQIYDRIKTLKLDFEEMFVPALCIIRPKLPVLETIVIAERFDFYPRGHIGRRNLSFPKHPDMHDIIHTTVCDEWFKQWMVHTAFTKSYFRITSPTLLNLRVCFQMAFCIERLENARLVSPCSYAH